MPVQFNYTGIVRKLDATAIPSQIVDEWAQTLLAEKDRLYSNLMNQIKDESSFISKLADPSSAAYAGFVNQSYPKAATAILKQKLKLRNSYNAWKNSVQSAFASGGVFETNVNAKKEKFRNVRYALSAVGEKSLVGLKPIVKAVALLTGDKTIKAYMGADDTLTGDAYNVFKAEFANYIKPMLVAKGVFATTYAFIADEANDTSTRDSIISSANTDFASILNAFKRTDVTFIDLRLQLSFDTANKYVIVTARAETT